ncbi:MAG: acyl transferase [Bacteroidia bacterium]
MANAFIDKIFSIKSKTEFQRLALEVFQYQYNNNIVYKNYVHALRKNIDLIHAIEDIPFLPISFFKSNEIICGPNPAYDKVFYSSTTTSSTPSRHFVNNINIYIESFRKGFEYFYGDIKKYCVLALLPSYLERDGSSLVFMVEDMIKRSNHKESGFYMHNYNELAQTLALLESKGQKIILLGVTYALLKLAEEYPMPLKNTIIMETGGMKGRRGDMPRQEIHSILKNAFSVDKIHSEYGMTELLSQAYSKGAGIFYCPPWMRIVIRDLYDPFQVEFQSGNGAINIIDLANINSCSFIATDDIGVLHSDGGFEVSGRIDYSDIRGCNLMAGDL